MLTGGSAFSGIGLLDYGLHLAGIQHLWLCESDPWRRTILAKRFPDARVLDDVRHLGADTAERVELFAGGFPCKGASTAGPQNGFEHPETALWREMRRAIGELEPRYVLIENVANLLALHDGAVWGEVLADLAALGFDVVWDCLPAAAVGAPHLRDRVFAVATHSARAGLEGRRLRGPTTERLEAAADAERECGAGRRAAGDVPGAAGEAQGEARERQRGWYAADDRGATSPDADLAREDAYAEAGGSRSAASERARGIAVDWAEYRPAIERWEAIHGPAPCPLVRRVDDRSASRVERSRLSALGDGVQVQVGYLAGAYIVDLERQRREALSHAA